MKNPDWNGSPPRDDAHAREIILDAANELAEDLGIKKLNIQNVAKFLKVTRQTIYRHFPSTDSLRTAIAIEKGGEVLGGVIEHTQGLTTFEEAAIESIIYLSKEIPRNEYLRSFFIGEQGKVGKVEEAFARNSLEYSYLMLKAVHPHGDDADEKWLFELAEHVQRILMTIILAPSARTKTEKELRLYLNKWLRPALVYPNPYFNKQ